MKKLTTLTAAALALGTVSLTAHGGEAAELIEKAKDANARAAEVGYEWRDTGKFIDRAEKALENDDRGTAMALAEKARRQAELAYKQYQRERKRVSDL